MKTSIASLLLPPALLASLAMILLGHVTAQSFTTLHSFTALSDSFPNFNNTDGAYPDGVLVLSGNILYGEASAGGSGRNGNGTLFAVNTDGTDFTILHNFAGFPSDGGEPRGGLILSGDTLFGTASSGGNTGGFNGTVFAVNTNGSGYTTLHYFDGYPSDGSFPHCSLVLSDNTLYGTTPQGGSSGVGIVFAVSTDGSGFTSPYSFTAPSGPYPGTNADGAYPLCGLIIAGNTLYGTAGIGPSGSGTAFAVNTDGTGLINLYNFTATSGSAPTNSDGADPFPGLILSGNTLYGTSIHGGSSGSGTVFAVSTNGTDFRTLHSFTATSGSGSTNSDGARPTGRLLASGNTLYGTAYEGGKSGSGTVFAVKTDGTGFTNLYSFTATSGSASINSDGANPTTGLILSSNTLYGTALQGGRYGSGTVFSLSLGSVSAPQLTLLSSLANCILSWPSSSSGFVLQSATTLANGGDWQDFPTPPTEVNGQKVVTIMPTGLSGFFRLRGP